MPADEDQSANPSSANRNNSRDIIPQTGRRPRSPTFDESPTKRRKLTRSASPGPRRFASSTAPEYQIVLRSVERQSEENFAPTFESSESKEGTEPAVEDGSDIVAGSHSQPDSLSSSQVIRSNDVTTATHPSANNSLPKKRPRSYSLDSEITWFTDIWFPPPETPHDMIFSERRAVDAVRRRALSATPAPIPYEADLTSKDRTRQKEAIRKTLDGKIKSDWDFNWPRKEGDPEPPVVDEQDAATSDLEWVDRDEWLSDVSDDEVESSGSIKPEVSHDSTASHHGHPGPHLHIFNHESASRKVDRRRSRHRQKYREESAWNDGLRCYTVRRDLWTGARYVRRVPKSKPKVNPQSTSSPPDEPSDDLDLDTQVPIAPPILPPETLMRRSLTEKAYPTIYDKVVLQSQTPYCPINLSIVVKSCVEGWKRDGEWPPKSGEVEAAIARKTPAALKKIASKSSAAGGEEKDSGGVVKDKGVFRRSLQKVFGVVHSGNGAKVKEMEGLDQH